MGRKSLKEARQKDIIKGFYKIAKKEGLENTSIAKIAKAMDINPSLVMHYFPTKEELVYGLVGYILDKYELIFNVPTHQGSARATLEEVINNLFSKKWNRLFDDSLSYGCYALAFRDKKIRGHFKNILDRLRSRLTGIIQACNQEGSLQIDDPQAVADLIFVMVDGAYYYASVVDSQQEYYQKLSFYKQQALRTLTLNCG